MAAPATVNAAQAFFGPIAAGTQVDRWHVVEVQDLDAGAIVVVLATETGAIFQVNVLRRDPDAGAAAGIGNTPSLSLFLRNNGTGATSTDEEQGLGVMALAAALAERERAGVRVPALLTRRQRMQLGA